VKGLTFQNCSRFLGRSDALINFFVLMVALDKKRLTNGAVAASPSSIGMMTG